MAFTTKFFVDNFRVNLAKFYSFKADCGWSFLIFSACELPQARAEPRPPKWKSGALTHLTTLTVKNWLKNNQHKTIYYICSNKNLNKICHFWDLLISSLWIYFCLCKLQRKNIVINLPKLFDHVKSLRHSPSRMKNLDWHLSIFYTCLLTLSQIGFMIYSILNNGYFSQ